MKQIDKIKEFLTQEEQELEKQKLLKGDSIVIQNREGLFERKEILNKKYVTNDGRELLKEVRFQG